MRPSLRLDGRISMEYGCHNRLSLFFSIFQERFFTNAGNGLYLSGGDGGVSRKVKKFWKEVEGLS